SAQLQFRLAGSQIAGIVIPGTVVFAVLNRNNKLAGAPDEAAAANPNSPLRASLVRGNFRRANRSREYFGEQSPSLRSRSGTRYFAGHFARETIRKSVQPGNHPAIPLCRLGSHHLSAEHRTEYRRLALESSRRVECPRPQERLFHRQCRAARRAANFL